MEYYDNTHYNDNSGQQEHKTHTSFIAAASDTQTNVMSHDWTTSDGLLPFNAPSLTNSRHYSTVKQANSTIHVTVVLEFQQNDSIMLQQ